MVLKADENKNGKQEKRMAEDGEEGETGTNTYMDGENPQRN